MSHRLEEKLQSASYAYEKGDSCIQAVFSAYKEELGISEGTARRMIEEFGKGIGSSEGICGVITAASAIIHYLSSEGRADVIDINGNIERIQKIFQREYGGITCREILKGKDPASNCCQMKVKDMILVIEQILRSMEWRDAS